MKKDFWIYIVCLGLLFTCGYLFYGEVRLSELSKVLEKVRLK